MLLWKGQTNCVCLYIHIYTHCVCAYMYAHSLLRAHNSKTPAHALMKCKGSLSRLRAKLTDFISLFKRPRARLVRKIASQNQCMKCKGSLSRLPAKLTDFLCGHRAAVAWLEIGDGRDHIQAPHAGTRFSCRSLHPTPSPLHRYGCHVISCHIIRCEIMSCHVISCRISPPVAQREWQEQSDSEGKRKGGRKEEEGTRRGLPLRGVEAWDASLE